MPTTPNLEITHVEQSQSGKEVVISTGFDEFDGAITDLVDKDVGADATPMTLTDAEAFQNMVIKLTGTHPGGTYNVECPDTNKKLYVVWNTSGDDIIFKTVSGTGVTVSDATIKVLYADGTNVEEAAGAVATLNAVGNVTITSATTNDILRWNGSAWINSTPAVVAGTMNLGELANVTAGSPSTDDALVWSGSAWVNQVVGSVAAAVRILDDTGDGTTVAFTITEANGGVLVFVDGVMQDEDEWSIVTTTLTFNTAPTNGSLVQAYDIGSNTASATAPYDVAVFIPDLTVNDANLATIVFSRAVDFPAGLTASQGYSGTNATSSTGLIIQKNGSNVGTATFTSGGATAAFAMASPQSFAAGDRLSIVNIASADATLANVSLTLKGTRS